MAFQFVSMRSIELQLRIHLSIQGSTAHVFCHQGQLLSSMQLTDSQIPSPMTSATSGTGADTIEDNYLPLYPGQVGLSDHPDAPNTLVSQCLPVAVAPMVPSTLDPTAALGETSVISPSSAPAANSACTHPSPPAPRLSSLVPLLAAPKPPHTFARPRHLQPTNANKKRDLKKISPASPIAPQQLFITGMAARITF